MTARTHPSRAALREAQLEQLRSLLTELFPGNAFYTRKLEDVGVTFDVASLEDFSARFPLTIKAELVADQLAHPPYGTNLTYPLASYTRFHQTSGTTGTPLRWLDTPDSWDCILDYWAEVFRAAGIGPGDRVCFAFSFGPFLGFWLAFESAERLGCLCLPTGGLSSAARLKVILDNAATVLCCTPTYAIRLGEVAAETGIDLRHSKVRRIIVAGEPGGSIPTIRARIEQLWPGARVSDHHGMTEVGPVTYECPAQPGVLHVIEAGYYPEIIDPKSGKPTLSDEPGELVLTTLGRIASPLLRYRTGDLVKRGARNAERGTGPCTCGTHELALAGGILGRVDDMVIVRGVNVYPGAVEEIVRSVGGIAEYQVTVTTHSALTELGLTIEPAPDCPDARAVAHKLASALETALSLRVPVTLATPGSLPRFEMKARRWLRE
jgi:phenylacetate-CoA ligase